MRAALSNALGATVAPGKCTRARLAVQRWRRRDNSFTRLPATLEKCAYACYTRFFHEATVFSL